MVIVAVWAFVRLIFTVDRNLVSMAGIAARVLRSLLIASLEPLSM